MRIASALLLTIIAFTSSQSSAQCLPGESLTNYHTGGYYESIRAMEHTNRINRSYTNVSHQITTRRLRNEIKFTEQRIAILRQRLREYRPFNNYRYGNALSVTVHETKSLLALEEQHLRELRLVLVEEQRAHRNQQGHAVLQAQRRNAQLAWQSISTNSQPKIEIVSHQEEVVGQKIPE